MERWWWEEEMMMVSVPFKAAPFSPICVFAGMVVLNGRN